MTKRLWLVVSYEPVPGVDGNVRPLRFATLATTLAAQGHDVQFWTSTFHHVKKTQRFPASTTVEVMPGFRAEFLFAPGYRHNRSPERWTHNRKLARAFRERARLEPQPDAIIACLHAVELSEEVAAYAKHRRIPLIIDIVDRWPDIYLTALPRWLRPLGRWLLSPEYTRSARVLAAATRLTAVSTTYLEWGERLASRSKDRGTVFPLSYPAPSAAIRHDAESRQTSLAASWTIPDDAMVCAFLGMFAGSYDVETVVEAARILHGRGRRDIHFILAGSGDNDRRIRAAAAGLPNVVLPGWIDQTTGVALLSRADIGLAAYARGAFQSLSYKPFEYMCFGLALLSCLPGELNELIARERIGLSYDPGDAEALAAQLEWCAENRDEVRAMGTRAEALFTREFDASEVYDRFARTLVDLAGR